MQEKAGGSDLDLAISTVYSDIYAVNALVPKTPVRASFFNYVTVLPQTAWLLFVFAGILNVILQSFNSKQFRRHKTITILKSLYLMFKIFVGESTSKFLLHLKCIKVILIFITEIRNLLVGFWVVSVSFFLVELMKNELLTQLTVRKYDYPSTFAELVASIDSYRFVGTSPKYLSKTNLPHIDTLAKKVIEIDFTNPSEVLSYMVTGKSVFLGGNLLGLSSLLASKKDKFTFLDEKFIWSQYVFFVSKKFRYWRETVRM